MRASRRVAPFVLLGLLILLSAGAIVFSLDTAPPIAQQELQIAARDTSAARSFVLEYNIRTFDAYTSSGSRAKKPVETGVATAEFTYQSPDRLFQVRNQNGVVISVLVIGNKQYERMGTGRWSALPSPKSTTSVGAQLTGQLLSVLDPMKDANSVVRSGGTYRFSPDKQDPFIKNLFGTSALLSNVRFSAALSGGLVKDEGISAVGSGTLYELDFSFSLIGSAPPVVTPAGFRS
jgi:hypothetical protein